MATQTLFIGMDGATFTVLDHLVNSQDGKDPVMPFLAEIYKNGSRAELESTPNPLTPPAWVSMMTGRTPGEHGVFDFIRAEEAGDDVFFTLYDSRDCLVETIWSMASRQGKRVAALNFPFTAPPPKDLNGFMIPGFIPWRHLRRNTAPKDFYDRLKSDMPDFSPKELAWDFEQEKQSVEELSDDDRESWVRYHLPREKQWFNIAEYLLVNEDIDLMAVMFDGVDKLQHQAWLFLSPELQKGELSEYHLRMRDLCLDYFRQLDSFLERLIKAAGPDAQVFMCSDHGFTTTDEVIRINTYLGEKGYLAWKPMPDTEEAKRREDSMFANLDWDKTTAYCRTPSSNGINIRVATEDGGSGIQPENYEQFRQQLIKDLEQLKDPDTGERIITGIHTREEVFSGPAMKDAPDILLVLRDHGFVSIKNKLPIVMPRDEVAGTHHPYGVFFGYGKGVNPGKFVERRKIEDVCATLLHSMEMDIPKNMEGKVAETMFSDQFLKDRPVVIGEPTRAVGSKDDSDKMEEDDKGKIMEQLRMLGYME